MWSYWQNNWVKPSPALFLAISFTASVVCPWRCGQAAAASQNGTGHIRPQQLLLCWHIIGNLQALDVDPRVAVNVADVWVAAVPRGQLVAHGLLHDLLHRVLSKPSGLGVHWLRVAGDGGVDGAVAVRVIESAWALPQLVFSVHGEREVRWRWDGAGVAPRKRFSRETLAVLKCKRGNSSR